LGTKEKCDGERKKEAFHIIGKEKERREGNPSVFTGIVALPEREALSTTTKEGGKGGYMNLPTNG